MLSDIISELLRMNCGMSDEQKLEHCRSTMDIPNRCSTGPLSARFYMYKINQLERKKGTNYWQETSVADAVFTGRNVFLERMRKLTSSVLTGRYIG